MSKSPRSPKQAKATSSSTWDAEKTYNLSELLSDEPELVHFTTWIVGDTPLIVHAWSEKAKRQMLEKQVGAAKTGKETRDPEQDFLNALYEMGDGRYGFPAMGVKNSWLSAAHKDKNIPKTTAMASIWIDGDMYRLRPGLAGAICDMPLLEIFGSEPEMREDMVSIGAGFKKVANLAYRPQFTVWGMRIKGRVNPKVVSPAKLARLANDGGQAVGIGEWRCEKKGVFGSYHLANVAEERQWEAYASGKGPLPVPEGHYASGLPIAAE